MLSYSTICAFALKQNTKQSHPGVTSPGLVAEDSILVKVLSLCLKWKTQRNCCKQQIWGGVILVKKLLVVPIIDTLHDSLTLLTTLLVIGDFIFHRKVCKKNVRGIHALLEPVDPLACHETALLQSLGGHSHDRPISISSRLKDVKLLNPA